MLLVWSLDQFTVIITDPPAVFSRPSARGFWPLTSLWLLSELFQRRMGPSRQQHPPAVTVEHMQTNIHTHHLLLTRPHTHLLCYPVVCRGWWWYRVRQTLEKNSKPKDHGVDRKSLLKECPLPICIFFISKCVCYLRPLISPDKPSLYRPSRFTPLCWPAGPHSQQRWRDNTLTSPWCGDKLA